MRSLLGAAARPVRAQDFAEGSKKLADGPLWNLRCDSKTRLVETLRTTLTTRNAERGESPARLERMQQGLDPNALWIGFARRFAPYKRAQLLFRDRARLKAILEQKDRPCASCSRARRIPRTSTVKRS
jgi:starch phosphorylase